MCTSPNHYLALINECRFSRFLVQDLARSIDGGTPEDKKEKVFEALRKKRQKNKKI